MTKDMTVCVEMYIRLTIDQAEFRCFVPVDLDSINVLNASAVLVRANMKPTLMADVVINLGNMTFIKNRYSDDEVSPDLVSHARSLPLTDYEVVAEYVRQQCEPKLIGEFTGEYHFLSNFHPAEFMYKGILWHNSEAAYQAMKSLSHTVHLEFAKMTNPVQAKRKGKEIRLQPSWDTAKFKIMQDIVFEKFNQNPELKQKLLATKNAILEEGNTWGDRVWGVCPPYSNNGENRLGHILMEVRRDLRLMTF